MDFLSALTLLERLKEASKMQIRSYSVIQFQCFESCLFKTFQHWDPKWYPLRRAWLSWHELCPSSLGDMIHVLLVKLFLGRHHNWNKKSSSRETFWILSWILVHPLDYSFEFSPGLHWKWLNKDTLASRKCLSNVSLSHIRTQLKILLQWSVGALCSLTWSL